MGLSKPLAMLFAVSGVLCMTGIGVALSYRLLWLAFAMLAAYVVVLGGGFMLKARLRRKQEERKP
jgi:hypothetical protein